MIGKRPSFLFFLVLTFIFSSLIIPVYAPDDTNTVDLTNFPLRLSEAFNISVFAGGLVASMIVMMAFILPVAIWSKNLTNGIFVGFLCLGFSIAVGWLDIFFILVPALIVAILYAGKMRDWIGGGGE